MHFDLNILLVLAVIAFSFFWIWLLLFKVRDKRYVMMHGAALSNDELEEHARGMAYGHAVQRRSNLINWPIPEMNENYRFILSVYKELNDDVQMGISTTPAAEWLLDNFYIIEEQVKGVRKALTKEQYLKLPTLSTGPLKGFARIYAIALELVSHTDGRIDEKIITNYINAYQSNNVLSGRELWAFPIMIKLALVENIKYLCEKIKVAQSQRKRVEEILSGYDENNPEQLLKLISDIDVELKRKYQISSAFIEHLAYKIRKKGRAFSHILHYVDERLLTNDTDIDRITHKEHSEQTIDKGSIGNCIMSLKYISIANWVEIFEILSKAEQILRKDPDGTYPLMDIDSRNYYRRRLEELALLYGVSETHIASKVVELADREIDKDDLYGQRKRHVGYYLIGKGNVELEKEIGYKRSALRSITSIVNTHPEAFYIGAVSVIALLIIGYVTKYAFRHGSIAFTLMAVFATCIPATDIAVNIVNWLMNHIYRPSFLPKMELKDSIPEGYSTMVVIPVLLTDEKRTEELIENLEVYYLANKEENLYFAIAGDFKDSSRNQEGNEKTITETALKMVKELNEKYARNGESIFFYFHRHRQYNDRQKRWMGWERKRGALIEFNEMLQGNKNTSYSIVSEEVSGLPKIKYVITLDADTILPLGTAKKLVGTMIHPLNRPVVNKEKGIVTEGYGLLQPRIGFGIESVNKSLFSRIFAGEEGIDPYASAISDVYQDLFGEGIFTGKGIYDLGIFQELLSDAIPENVVLSHDLLEGSYIRAGLVTDLELIDGYPAKLNSYAMRLHRWVRGDWQLLPWLGAHIVNRNGDKIPNPLSLISKWKILDNLRRSLVAPLLMLIVILGASVLPGNFVFWMTFVLLTICFPIIIAGIDYIVSMPLIGITAKRYIPVISGMKAALLRTTLQFVFLPYEAYLMVNAIAITLARVFITKRNMLEWVTASDVERSLKNSAKGYIIRMRWAIIQAFLVLGLTLWLRPDSVPVALFVFAIWILSPFVAYFVSKEQIHVKEPLDNKNKQYLRRISRKTWRYFEEFANKKNNYLAPDNFQENPPNGIAYRTSPTNIGLGMLASLTARDMGYIGTHELLRMISNTTDTIEKMDKWNGHLYNWYDTRTLKPLIPRYVSTVDSGNFVCYLITLKEGLLEYLNKPLVDRVFVQGINDTADLAFDKKACQMYISSFDDFIKSFDDANPGDIILWGKALDKACASNGIDSSKDKIWSIKLNNMLDMFKGEIREFMPWAVLIADIPDVVTELHISEEMKKLWEAVVKKLKACTALSELPKVCRDATKDIEKIQKHIGKDKKVRQEDAVKWLLELKNLLLKSSEHTERLVGTCTDLVDRISRLSDNTEFTHLYDSRRQLFSIGYSIEDNTLTNSYYDLLASEARQTSFIAIARGEVDSQHWFKLGRTLTYVDRYKGMVSWSGTMFEYLMPLLIMKSYKNTLMDETYSFAVRSQKKYGNQRNVPWGTSESGFYSLDINLDYQYKAFGVPWLGLKRGLVEDMVVAPYATVLAILVEPMSAIKNLKRMAQDGVEGHYGFYEAVDYTPERLPVGEKRAIVKSYMAHHQGMSILALNNLLNDEIMQRRFHADPVVDAAKLLLQEKVPTNVVFTKENKEKIIPFKEVIYDEVDSLREYEDIDPIIPKVHLLSNGSYSVMVTDRGTGYSRSKMLDVTRWREDITLDNYGMFFYIRNIRTNEAWSSTYAPFIKRPDKYRVTFKSGEAKFFRKDGDIDTLTEVVVSAGDNLEIRRINITNHGSEPSVLEVTSYFELVLAAHSADVAHPAFSNLFIRTEFLPELNSLIANRRPRTDNEKVIWAVSTMTVEGETVGGTQYESDRMQFVGRGRDVRNPIVLEPNRPLSNTAGAVLDPVMSLSVMVNVEPGSSVKITYVTAVTESREVALEIATKYKDTDVVEGEFNLALTRSRVEARYLNLKSWELELYQELVSHILFLSPQRVQNGKCMENNRKGQSSLWTYGISGDIPIVLVMLEKTDEIDIVNEILKAHEYWKFKNLRVDLVILNEEENSYTNPLNGLLSDVLSGSHARDMMNKPGGVFVLRKSNMPEGDIMLLCSAARLVIKGNSGELKTQIKEAFDKEMPEMKSFDSSPEKYNSQSEREPELRYYNGLGGFLKDGKEYVIHLENNNNTPLPWSNVISNREFGFLVTEAGSGYIWYENSRENKLTPWTNDPVSDLSGEILYIGDNHTGELWTITPLPIRGEEPYTIRHGFGYTVFEHSSHGIHQVMTQFVPVKDSVKISVVKLTNESDKTRELSLTYYIRPVLGVSDQSTAPHIITKSNESGAVLIKNNFNEEFPESVVIVDCSIEERSVTGDRKEFFGMGGIENPEGLKRVKLSDKLGVGLDPCVAMNVNVVLRPGEETELVFLTGAGKDEKAVEEMALRYRKPVEAVKALKEVKEFWKEKLCALQFYTPEASMDLMLNGWLVYQVVSCRLWTRSAFYQSGGAFGFRDQLQDCLSVAHIWPELTRNQILLHSRHQFLEGDVQHWWHEPKNKGTRTRFSDDLLWMPYVTAAYISITGDYEILSEKTPFLEDEPLREFEDEAYRIPRVSETFATLYDHCIRAIERSLKFGEHGLPLMGSGDWNDGMNTVGNKGKGESVWLGWFLYSILNDFAPICESMSEGERAKRYLDTAQNIINSIEENAWDGSWYRRAYFDNGQPLGSFQNSECKIDSLSQSWAVISEGGNKDRIVEAMNALENYLVKRDEGLIKLLTPPFDESDLEPGYIKSYVPGVRENGGQYTHAAAWVVMAYAKMGDGDKAFELFELLNPVNHSRTHIEYSTYKAEPYVMAADVYSVHPHTGRGGWTWYTGAAGWIYRVGFEYILGFKKRGDKLFIDPCIPRRWSGYDIKYRHGNAVYLIEVKNPDEANKGVKEIILDGVKHETGFISLVNDGLEHRVEVVMGK